MHLSSEPKFSKTFNSSADKLRDLGSKLSTKSSSLRFLLPVHLKIPRIAASIFSAAFKLFKLNFISFSEELSLLSFTFNWTFFKPAQN
jgi:hypothetical protein